MSENGLTWILVGAIALGTVVSAWWEHDDEKDERAKKEAKRKAKREAELEAEQSWRSDADLQVVWRQ